MPRAIVKFDHQLSPRLRQPAVVVPLATAVRADVTAPPSLTQDDAERIAAGPDEITDIEGLVDNPIVVVSPARGELMIADPLAVQRRAVQAVRGGVQAGPGDALVRQLELSAQIAGRSQPTGRHTREVLVRCYRRGVPADHVAPDPGPLEVRRREQAGLEPGGARLELLAPLVTQFESPAVSGARGQWQAVIGDPERIPARAPAGVPHQRLRRAVEERPDGDGDTTSGLAGAATSAGQAPAEPGRGNIYPERAHLVLSAQLVGDQGVGARSIHAALPRQL